MEINVNGVGYKVIYSYDLYYPGWECDSTGYVVEDGAQHKHVHTNHGTPYFAKESELLSFVEDYKKAIKDIDQAIKLVRISER